MNLLAFDTSTDTLSIAVQRGDTVWEHSGPGGAQASSTLIAALYGLLVAAGMVTSHLAQAPWSEILFQMAFQGMGSVVISGISFTRMVQYYGPVRSTMVTALVPGLSAMGAVLFLDEPMHWSLVAGLLLVTGGILLGVLRKSQAAA